MTNLGNSLEQFYYLVLEVYSQGMAKSKLTEEFTMGNIQKMYCCEIKPRRAAFIVKSLVTLSQAMKDTVCKIAITKTFFEQSCFNVTIVKRWL